MLISPATAFFRSQAAMPATEASSSAAGGHAAAGARAEDPLFASYVRANASVESGGRVVPSRLVTTAGAGNPASYGSAQLLVSLQVASLRSLERARPGTLARAGLETDRLAAMDARGRAATDYYDAVVRGRPSASLSHAENADLLASARRRDAAGLVARHGEAFERATGIPRAELAAMVETRELVHGGAGAAYRSRRARGDSREAALDRAVLSHPSLRDLRERMGDASLAYFLARPRRNGEHRAGWYTRAVRSLPGDFESLTTALSSGLDSVTSGARARRNFGSARALVDALPGASAASRARRDRAVLAIARLRHGSPAFVASRLGTPAAPRLRDFEALERFLDGLRHAPVTSAEGDHGRSVSVFLLRVDASSPTGP